MTPIACEYENVSSKKQDESKHGDKVDSREKEKKTLNDKRSKTLTSLLTRNRDNDYLVSNQFY